MLLIYHIGAVFICHKCEKSIMVYEMRAAETMAFCCRRGPGLLHPSPSVTPSRLWARSGFGSGTALRFHSLPHPFATRTLAGEKGLERAIRLGLLAKQAPGPLKSGRLQYAPALIIAQFKRVQTVLLSGKPFRNPVSMAGFLDIQKGSICRSKCFLRTTDG